MEEDNIEPSIDRYLIFIDFFSKHMSVDFADYYYIMALEKGLKPTFILNNIMINLYVKIGRITGATNLFKSTINLFNFIEGNNINFHGFSHGAAYIATCIFINSIWKKSPFYEKPFTLITGKGLNNRSTPPYGMQNFLLPKLQKDFPFIKFEALKEKGVIEFSKKEVSNPTIGKDFVNYPPLILPSCS